MKINKIKSRITQKSYLGLFILIIWHILIGQVFAQQNSTSSAEIQGYIDSFIVNEEKFHAQGWAAPTDLQTNIVSIIIKLDGIKVYEGSPERFNRPDVTKATNRADWIMSGWRIESALPPQIKNGKYDIEVAATLDNGHTEKLLNSAQAQQVYIGETLEQGLPSNWKIKIFVLSIFAFLIIIYFTSHKITNFFSQGESRFIRFFTPSLIFGYALSLGFFGLVALGITGSSFSLGLAQTPYVNSNVQHISGTNQPIRSDEWLVFTPLSIAQYNHVPRFPIVNKNIGEDGQNMLIAGMLSVPVAHISSIAKPATWGFFLFDLKRALSWQWNFPIFAGLLALWAAICILLPNQWKFSFLIALYFSLSPYVKAWSNWPAYAVFFPSLCFVIAIAIIKSKGSKYTLFLLGGILGISLAGYALVLYPPWQISLAYLFAAIFLGVVIKDKLHQQFSVNKLFAFGIALSTTGAILALWWKDAYPAVEAIRNTVYPGQRAAITGGNGSFQELLRGFSNLITLYKVNPNFSNQSEVSSFFYVLAPLGILFIYRWHQKALDAVDFFLASIIIFILYFTFVGIPSVVAVLTQWGRVQPLRADIALGLSAILLCGLLLKKPFLKHPGIHSKLAAAIVAFTWAGITFLALDIHQKTIIPEPSSWYIAGLTLISAVLAYYLVTGKARAFIYLNLLLSLITVWKFTPNNIAPSHVTAELPIHNPRQKQESHIQNERILVMGSQIPSMYLAAAGIPIANGVFYYPQKTLWERLDADHNEVNKYNRYQHLIYTNQSIKNERGYEIDSPSPDVVKISIDLDRFDFSKAGASFITAPTAMEENLRRNHNLDYIKSHEGWAWFKVLSRSR